MLNKKRGFTLIELLVVIAIIGILSAVVLASLNTGRSKAGDSAVKSNLDGIRAQAELLYDDNGASYGNGFSTTAGTTQACPTSSGNNLFATTTIIDQIAGAMSAGGGSATCATDTTTGTDAQKWVVAAQLKTDTAQAWCIDSSGAAKEVAWSAVSGQPISTQCP